MGLKISDNQFGIMQAAAHFIRTGRMDLGAELVERFGMDNSDIGIMGDFDRCQLVRLNLERGFELGGVELMEPGFDHEQR